MRPTQSQIALGVGVTIGLALPPLIQYLTKLIRATSSSSKNDKNDNQTTSTKTADTNAVRSGLSDNKSAIRLPRSNLEEFLSQILVKAGASPSHADLAASVLAYADYRGIPSHGANRADLYANELSAGAVDGHAIPVVEQKSGCCAVVNGKNGLGAVTSDLAINTAISLAKEHGVGFVVCRMSNHFGAAGYWAQRALEADMMGMSFTNTSPVVVPTCGNSRAVGTNPFCFFAPVRDGGHDDKEKLSRSESFQLDMATSVVPIGKVEVMHRLGKSCLEGWGVDFEGMGTTDAEEICRRGGLYPLGGSEETAGYKGYGLAMFVEILCSVLSGAAIGPSVQPWLASREGHIDYGHCFIVIDPSRFTSGFDERLSSYIEAMRSLPGHVKVPGDPERVFEEDADKNGVILHKPVAATLKTLANKFGVEIPSALENIDISASKESLYVK
eukprot:CAMPEP_0185741748 /NCGR_PEP_ID=MMETSP1171-20130828/39122_1 /TAXON_ID=374046 /ORGANISM="Helicotheca tamensis, Strain CCMP826" /LENGTH=442 /DNA_ID=CAMNT_0028413733 /DNA_START=34 /DNA_END=1362 /DNA_ORIENTATION=-